MTKNILLALQLLLCSFTASPTYTPTHIHTHTIICCSAGLEELLNFPVQFTANEFQGYFLWL